MQNEQFVAKLHDKRMRIRLKALKALNEELKDIETPLDTEYSINYVFRTVYSCFDKTPSLAVYYTSKFGMPLTATVDYASLASSKELIRAQKIVGGLYYCGAEVSSLYNGQRLVLSAIGVPHQNLKQFNDDLAPYRSKRLSFSNALREKLNQRFKKYSISLPYAFWSLFGAIKTTSTEDLYVNLASKIIEKLQSADKILAFLTDDLKLELSDADIKKLEDTASPLYLFDLALTLHSSFKIKHPNEDMFPAEHFVGLCSKYGAISSATYKGGDLNEFITTVKALGVQSATAAFCADDQQFMQTFFDLCMDNGILPIIRVVVDHPRNNLNCKFENGELAKRYKETTLSIVGHEISASTSVNDGMFSAETVEKFPSLLERIKLYSRIGSKGL